MNSVCGAAALPAIAVKSKAEFVSDSPGAPDTKAEGRRTGRGVLNTHRGRGPRGGVRSGSRDGNERVVQRQRRRRVVVDVVFMVLVTGVSGGCSARASSARSACASVSIFADDDERRKGAGAAGDRGNREATAGCVCEGRE